MSDPICWLSAIELAQRIRRREIRPIEAVDACLAQIDRVNDRVNAVVTRVDELAREAATEAEKALENAKDVGPLHGVPFTAKDVHLTAGVRTTFGSRLYENHVPDWDHPIVERLKRAGAILIGKTNTSEFGLIPLAANALFGDSCNPWNTAHNTGGSSGGAAAAVCCGIGPLATGSDGGGSIRVPASFCGVFGIKPQMGRIPHVAFPRGWETVAHQGPLTRTVRDAALFLDVTCGRDPRDRRSLPGPSVSFASACEQPPCGKRLAWCPHLGNLPVEPEVRTICERAARRFEELGCHVEELTLDLPDLTRDQQVIAICEAATAAESRRAEWEKVIYPPIRKMLPKSDRYTYKDLVRAHWARDIYWEQLGPVFEQFDALLTPTVPITAPPNGSLGPATIDGRPVRTLAWLSHCVPFNMTWQPAASIPAGFDASGLPVGLQLVGRPFDEATLFSLASAFEQAHPWSAARPPVVSAATSADGGETAGP